MKKTFVSIVIITMMTLGTIFVSCTSKTSVNTPQEDTAAVTDSTLFVTAESNIKAHQEDIQALWELSFGEEKKIDNYHLAKDYVFISTEDGKDGLLLSFFKDMKDIDNFDGIPVSEGQELFFQGNALIVKDKNKTTYFEKTEKEGFNELFTVTEKDGKKVYTDDLGKPYQEKEAQKFLEGINKETAISLNEIMGEKKIYKR